MLSVKTATVDFDLDEGLVLVRRVGGSNGVCLLLGRVENRRSTSILVSLLLSKFFSQATLKSPFTPITPGRTPFLRADYPDMSGIKRFTSNV